MTLPFSRPWAHRLAVLVCAVLALGLAAAHCAPVPVVTTTTMITDLVRQVGGDRVLVSGLMGPGVDPHLYKPGAGDVAALQRAKAIFYNGLHLEGRMEEVLERAGRTGKTAVALAASLPPERLLRSEGEADPHIWGDASLWAQAIPAVVAGLAAVDPEGRAVFESRGAAYRQQLEALHAWAVKRAAEVPAERRILVTSHDAFGYTGRAYGFQVVGVQGISTVGEAGSADVVKVADYIRSKGVKAIFVESSVPRATIERIAKDSGARLGGELYSDAMAAPGTQKTAGGETYDAGTYLGMLKHNVNTAVDALK